MNWSKKLGWLNFSQKRTTTTNSSCDPNRERTKKAVLFINLGTPKSPSICHVFSYLREFLTDWRVISLPFIVRQLLVNCIIIPLRIRQSSKNYRSIWMEEGSPLMAYSMKFLEAMKEALRGSQISPYFAMRYQEPSLKKVLHEIQKQGHTSLLVIPLYPQYASATTGSSIEKLMEEMRHWKAFPHITIVQSFFQKHFFVKSWAEKLHPYARSMSNDTKVLFCFHGLPQRQVVETNPCGSHCFTNRCCEEKPSQDLCYVAQCKKTAEAIRHALALPPEQCEIVFQSRLGKDPWTGPFIADRLKLLPQEGIQRAIIVSASFVADCIETIEELGQECRQIFLSNGGKEFILIDSLNDSPIWIQGLHQLIESHFKNIND